MAYMDTSDTGQGAKLENQDIRRCLDLTASSTKTATNDDFFGVKITDVKFTCQMV